MTLECLFCRIAAGEVSAHEIHRDEALVVFLDIGPIRDGHVQIIPRAHYASFDVLPDALASAILHLGQRIARVQKAVLGVPRVAFFFTGGDIAHAHAHLVPMWDKHDVTSPAYIAEQDLTFRPVPHPGDASLAAMAQQLRKELEN